jgi:hypothetical protein
MRCPGQDTRYWTGEAAFDVACPKCGHQVEFFKDEGSQRCPNCRHKFQNPKMSFDCAQWCAYAEECLGFMPEQRAPANAGEGVLASRLIRAVKEEYAGDASRVARALLAFQHARELLAEQGGDPRTILAAAVLLAAGVDRRDPRRSAGPDVPNTGGMPVATRILREIGFEEDTIGCVCRIAEAHRTGRELDTIEFKVVSDANVLARRGQTHGRELP